MHEKIFWLPVIVLLLSACHGRRSPGASRQDVKPDAVAGGALRGATIADSTPHESPVVLAMLPFRNDAGSHELDPIGLQLIDGLSTHLGASPVKVVERERLGDVMNELHLSDLYADPATAVRVGRLLGANIVLLGAYSKLNGDTLVMIRIVKVETGEVIGGFSESGHNIPALTSKSADRLIRALSSPVQR